MRHALVILLTLLTALAPPLAQAETPPDGLVSYWSFDDNTADSAWLYLANVGAAEDNLRHLGGPAQYVPGIVRRAIPSLALRVSVTAVLLGLALVGPAIADETEEVIDGKTLAIVRDDAVVTVKQGDRVVVRYRYAGRTKRPHLSTLTSPGGRLRRDRRGDRRLPSNGRWRRVARVTAPLAQADRQA